jgi:hydrogenase maturation protein HypF
MPGAKGMNRHRLLVNGIVQGVGFRPFVFNLAEGLELVGYVTNTSAGVVIEVQGPERVLADFARRLRHDAPPLADIVTVDIDSVEPVPDEDAFVIRPSENLPGTATLVPPDVAVCSDCRREIADPGDRRHGYPFTNCTNCGPRWTIIDRIPYDRPFTSMASFRMCAACQAEYDDPRDRRFHAQPNACPECGPRVWLSDPSGVEMPGEALESAAGLLAAGKIVAIKGLGGFHLAVRADNEQAVQRLRRRKGREAKPLAVMVADLAAARQLGDIGEAEADLLTSPASPIVLLERKSGGGLASAVCGDHRRVGVMLAYTPLHQLLLQELAGQGITTLVMTSGNASDEPICLENDQALERLGGIADALLLHDRDILRRADDSVLQVLPCGPLVFRRGRGMAPVPVHLDEADQDGPPILAVGPELKNTVCLLKENRAFLSPHIGDLENLEANEFFRQSVKTLQDLLECEPGIIAHDLHPGYFSTQYARSRSDARLIGVQHHHAHLAAVTAELHLEGPVIGLIMDGTGYGTDGTIWGGEVLVGNAAGFDRFAHLETIPLPGGRRPSRRPGARRSASCAGPSVLTRKPGRSCPGCWGVRGTHLRARLMARFRDNFRNNFRNIFRNNPCTRFWRCWTAN